MNQQLNHQNYLSGSSCYLAGPIEHDPNFGRDWREVVSGFLKELNIKVYNPLDRPKWMTEINKYVPPTVSRSDILNIEYEYNSDTHEYFPINTHEAIIYRKSQRLIRTICKRYVSTTDFVFAYLPNTKTFGTIEELGKAADLGKPIIMVCPDVVYPSLWVDGQIALDKLNIKSNALFSSIDGAMGFINNINSGKVHLDALKWIFIDESYPHKILSPLPGENL